MNKKKISIYFTFISFFSFLTIFSSIVQKSYFNLVNPIKDVESNELLKPINPNLDLDIIKDIELRPENIDTEPFNFSLDESLVSNNLNENLNPINPTNPTDQTNQTNQTNQINQSVPDNSNLDLQVTEDANDELSNFSFEEPTITSITNE